MEDEPGVVGYWNSLPVHARVIALVCFVLLAGFVWATRWNYVGVHNSGVYRANRWTGEVEWVQ